MLQKDHIYSLKELSLIVDGTCKEMFDEFFFWCRAEVASVKQYGSRTYIDLVQAGQGGEIVAKVTAIVWRKQLLDSFLESTGFLMTELVGQELLVQSTLNGSLKYGFNCTIHSFSKEFTKGKQVENKDMIRKHLLATGVYGLNKSKSLKPGPLSIAVISSKQSAGLNDFLAVLKESGYAMTTKLFESRVEGNVAAQGVIDALSEINNEIKQGISYNSVCIVRGGGGKEGFAWQNDQLLAEMICSMPVPVCIAIGHTEDTSILDEVVWWSAKTPTDAGYRLIEHYETQSHTLNSIFLRVNQLVDNRLTAVKQSIPFYYRSIQNESARRLSAYRNSIDGMMTAIGGYSPGSILAKGFFLVKVGKKYISPETIHDAKQGSEFTIIGRDGERRFVVQ